MKSCPNPSCPYALKFKRAGEYQDTAASCSDCGAPLVEGATPIVATSARPVLPSDANQRLLITIVAGVAFAVLSHVPVMSPGSVMSEEDGFGLMGRSSEGRVPALLALAVGMTPIMSAFILIELIALAVPPLRRLRTGGAAARRKLDRAAWILSGVLLLVQLFGILRYRAAVGGEQAGLLIWAQLLLAPAAMLALAFSVTRFGLGNGFALLMAVTFVDSMALSAAQLYRFVLEGVISLPVFLLFVAMLGAIAWASARLGRAGRGGSAALPSAVPFPVSSNGSWSFAVAMVALPATLSAWVSWASTAAHWLQTSQALYTGLLVFIAFDAALVFGFLFYRPQVIGTLWAKWVPGVDQTGVVAKARALLPVALGLSIGATVGMPLVLMVLGTWAGVMSAASMGILVLVVTCAVVDVMDEWSALRRLGPLISVWELQRTAEVEPIFHLLRTVGIEAHARSFLLRATQQFFAPWIPMSILVPVSREAEARALLASRLVEK